MMPPNQSPHSLHLPPFKLSPPRVFRAIFLNCKPDHLILLIKSLHCFPLSLKQISKFLKWPTKLSLSTTVASPQPISLHCQHTSLFLGPQVEQAPFTHSPHQCLTNLCSCSMSKVKCHFHRETFLILSPTTQMPILYALMATYIFPSKLLTQGAWGGSAG